MSYGSKNKIKTEHSGAKNGGGYWGTRNEAKIASRKIRRLRSKSVISENLRDIQGQSIRHKE